MSEHSKPSRRRVVAAGAAWSVPVIVVGAPAPAFSASPPNEECQPVLTIQPGSYKCCNTATKNMKVVLTITDANNCGIPVDVGIALTTVLLANGQDPGTILWQVGESDPTPEPPVIMLGETFTVYLLGTHSCTVNLLVGTVAYGMIAVQSDNIPGGNTEGDCQPLV